MALEKVKNGISAINLFGSVTGLMPVELISGIFLMAADGLSLDRLDAFKAEMKRLSGQGYDAYAKLVEAGEADTGIPVKKNVLAYLNDCIDRLTPPSVEGLCAHAQAEKQEAEALLQAMQRHWLQDLDFITQYRIYDSLSRLDALDAKLKSYGSYSAEQYQALRRMVEAHEDELRHPFAHYIDDQEPLRRTDTGSLFDYASNRVPFAGREEELKALTGFCEDERPLLWWSVTGDGGTGKSRLAYEFCRRQMGGGWTCLFLGKSFFDRMGQFKEWSFPYNLLIVIDYTAFYGRRIGEWLAMLDDSKSAKDTKKRILLLERTGGAEGDAGPQWYGEMCGGGGRPVVTRLCYSPDTLCYRLGPLSDEAMSKTVQTVAQEYGNDRMLDITDTQNILNLLAKIDPEHSRPLYLLFLMQAWLDHEEKLYEWDMDDLDDFIYMQEASRIEQIMKAPAAEEATTLLRTLATIIGSYSLEDEDIVRLPFVRDVLVSVQSPQYTRAVFCKNLRDLCGGEYGFVTPYMPDLIGKYFVLRTFAREEYKGLLGTVMQAAWTLRPLDTVLFLHGVGLFYLRSGKKSTFDRLLCIGQGVFQEPNSAPPSALFSYSMLLASLVNFQENFPDKNEAIEKLRLLSNEFKDLPLFSLEYAKGLFYLSQAQELHEKEKTNIKLCYLAHQHKNSPEIAIVSAKGLFNLCTAQTTLHDKKTAVKWIFSLSQIFPHSSEIALVYARGLCYLLNNQEEEDALETFDQLHELLHSIPGIREMYLQHLREYRFFTEYKKV